MSTFVRGFVATHCDLTSSPCAREILSQLDGMAPAVRVVPLTNLHLTYQFLGEMPRDAIEPLVENLRESLSEVAPSVFRARGVGAFPNPRRPSVVWIGLEAEAVSEIHAAVQLACESVGFAPEDRPWTPHITIGRVKKKPPSELSSLLERFAETEFGTFSVDCVTLFQSTLRPEGPVYSPLAEIELDQNNTP